MSWDADDERMAREARRPAQGRSEWSASDEHGERTCDPRTCERCRECDICGEPMTDADRREYEAEGGEGFPACHADCADREVNS